MLSGYWLSVRNGRDGGAGLTTEIGAILTLLDRRAGAQERNGARHCPVLHHARGALGISLLLRPHQALGHELHEADGDGRMGGQHALELGGVEHAYPDRPRGLHRGGAGRAGEGGKLADEGALPLVHCDLPAAAFDAHPAP